VSDEARQAYKRRRATRARRQRAETQGLRLARERRQLAGVLRRDLARLADGAAELARQAEGKGAGAAQASARLDARRKEAAALVSEADRFDLDPALLELPADARRALALPDA
jgi:hypothetical protein